MRSAVTLALGIEGLHEEAGMQVADWPPNVLTWPTRRGRPALSCVTCQSRVMVPALPTCVLVSARAGAVHSVQASRVEPITVRGCLMVVSTPIRSPGWGKRFPRSR
jgi:hypothetical protein